MACTNIYIHTLMADTVTRVSLGIGVNHMVYSVLHIAPHRWHVSSFYIIH